MEFEPATSLTPTLAPSVLGQTLEPQLTSRAVKGQPLSCLKSQSPPPPTTYLKPYSGILKKKKSGAKHAS